MEPFVPCGCIPVVEPEEEPEETPTVVPLSWDLLAQYT